MGNRISLLLGALLLAGIVSFFLMQNNSAQDTSEPAKLFPTLQEQGNALESIVVANSRGEQINLVKQDEKWLAVLQGVALFPANPDTLSNIVAGLSTGKLIEAKTSNPKLYPKLHLTSLDNSASQATSIILKGPQEEFKVLVGKASSGMGGSYVRKPESAKSYLLDKVIQLPQNTVAWLQQPIFEVELDSVTKLTRKGDDGYTLLRADGSEDFIFSSPIEPRNLQYESVLTTFVSAFVEIDFSDITLFDEPLWAEKSILADFVLSYQQGENEEQLHLTLGQKEESYFVKVESNAFPHAAPWVFALSDYDGKNLAKSQEDFLQPLPEATDKQE